MEGLKDVIAIIVGLVAIFAVLYFLALAATLIPITATIR